MDAAGERGLTMREWKERHALRPETPSLSAPAAKLIAEERALRDKELAADLYLGSGGMSGD